MFATDVLAVWFAGCSTLAGQAGLVCYFREAFNTCEQPSMV